MAELVPTNDPDDAPFDPADASRPERAPRPKDAATLVLIRTHRSGPQVLMGQRSKGHVFMPDKWVFPGGRVDRADAVAPAATELTETCVQRLRHQAGRRAPRAFALAAIRETWEETGLIVGRRGAPTQKAPPGWESYYAADALPELHKLTFICRAITPPYRPRRFDARFFMAAAEDVLMDDRPIGGGPELLHTEWFSFEEALKLDLPSVTRFVIGEAQEILGGVANGPPFLRFTRGSHRVDRL
ncbi:MAG: NUDIX domain-containing protein [Alphaproteobacteria bacterium]|nr:NUDIX domain-containing protein [Alphaproteobacteria bacterium]